MLKSKSVAKLIQTTLNMNDSEKFRVVYEVGGYKGADINCILKQGKGTIRPILNYTNVNTPFKLEIIVPTGCGEDRIDGIVDIVNGVIGELNGKVKNIDNGKAVFLFSPLEIGQYDTRATAGQSVIMKLDFVVEYSSKSGTKYEMALMTTPFEYGTQNVRRFNNQEEKEVWINDRITDAPLFEILTPNVTSLVITQQRYLNPRSVDINDLSMFNYAVIKETKWNDDVNYYFYYVTNANIDQYNTLLVDLKLDTITTFYDKIEFGDCFISKAHLNRFIENPDGTVSFNAKIDSPLFEREDYLPSDKVLTKRDVVAPFYTGYEDIDNWYQNNILGWLYIYLSGGQDYKIGDGGSGSYGTNDTYTTKFGRLIYSTFSSSDNTQGDVFYNTLSCMVVPVYKTNNRIKLKSPNIEVSLTTRDAINEFITSNGSSYIYAIKFSIVPPIDIQAIIDNSNLYSVGTDLTITCTDGIYSSSKRAHMESDLLKDISIYRNVIEYSNGMSRGSAFLILNRQNNINIETLYTYNNQDYSKIFKSQIVNENTPKKRDINLNPKLYNADYMSLVVSDNTQNGASYDILKLGASGKVYVNYTEALTPDITKVYIRCRNINNENGIYHIGTRQNLTGFVGSDDKSIILENSAYQTMLANNKNFFLQNSTNRAFDVGQSMFGAVTSALQGAFLTGGNPVGAVVGAGVSIAQTTTNAIKSKINQNFTVDNLKNAPNSISGAMGNVVFNSLYSDVGIVIETHEILPFEKQIIDDQMYLNGFSFNKIDNVKKYDNIRHYFNFVQANIENIIGDISNPIREDIRQRFADGIRFWNEDNIDYTMENYERWLNNEL